MMKAHRQVLILAVLFVVSLMITGIFIPGTFNKSNQHDLSLSGNSGLNNMKFSSTRTGLNNGFLLQNPSNSVNVNYLNTVEPAPMGIADYGIGNNNVAYSYNTSSFLGIINITHLQTHNGSLSCSNEMGFQLNVNLVFCDGTTQYVYWVQDVISLNTTSSNQQISFIDNIWNMSSSSANMHNSSISGNGVVANSSGTFFYYACANATCPGNSKILTYPTYVKLKVDSITTSNNQPEVKFLYNDGQGWITYDNVIFKFVKQLSNNLGFVVDGHQYEPDGYSFYNAALIMGGPGDGSQTSDASSNVHLQLEFWNGHNFQQIVSAYNFGSDTAEGIQNVVSTAEACNSNGTLFASVTSGSGSLKQIYNQSDVSIVNITTGLNAGSLKINGTAYSFINSFINLTISTGKYNYEIYNGNGIIVTSGNFTAYPGFNKIIPLFLTYKVNFSEISLLPGTEWFVNLSDGQTYSSLNSNISFNLPNGTYYYTIASANKIDLSNISSGSFKVAGASIQINISFSEVTYSIKFVETGLSLGAIWYVNISGELSSGEISSSSYSILLTNGTYYYTVSTSDKIYEVSSTSTSSFSFNVNGASSSITVTFSEVKYPVTFSETGLPSGTPWYINLSNNMESGQITGSSYSFSIINGTYFYSISTSDKIYSTSSAFGSFNESSGVPASISISFTPNKYSVTFIESGLPNGSTWYVNLSNGASSGAITGSSYSFLLVNGSYNFTVGIVNGYSASPQKESININGANLSNSIVFNKVNTQNSTGVTNNMEDYEITGGLIAIFAIVGVALYFIKKK